MKNTNKLLILSTLAALGAQSAHATSTFSTSSTVTITIESISNNTNSGDLSGIFITDGFWVGDKLTADGFGKIVSGNADSSYSYTGGYQDGADGTLISGDSITQNFSAAGQAINGSVDAYYQAYGNLYFNNNSSDNYTIEYSIEYDLYADTTGEMASSTIALEYSNDLGDIDGYEEANASTALNSIEINAPTIYFTLTLDSFESDVFYADTSITGYATAVAPVPLPAAGWLMLSGLVFLRRYNKPTS